MNLRKVLPLITAVVLMCVTACAGMPQKEWSDNFAAAQKQSAKSKKPLLLVFTSPSFNEESKLLDALITSPEFILAAAKDFVLCRIEYAQDDDTETDPVQKEKYRIAERYQIPGLPTVVVLSPGGFMYYCGTYIPDAATPESYLNVLSSLEETKNKVTELEHQATKSSGTEKATILDSLISAGIEDALQVYRPYMQEIISLDVDNASGLFNKYTLEIAYMDAGQMFESNPERAFGIIENLLTLDNLPAEEIQKIYYMLSYFTAMSGAEPDKVIGYLTSAINADPDNQNTPMLQNLLENLKAMPESE